jgi:hypothetical protein
MSTRSKHQFDGDDGYPVIVDDTLLREAVTASGSTVSDPARNITHGGIQQRVEGPKSGQYATVEWSAYNGKFLRATTGRSVLFNGYRQFCRAIESGQAWSY